MVTSIAAGAGVGATAASAIRRPPVLALPALLALPAALEHDVVTVAYMSPLEFWQPRAAKRPRFMVDSTWPPAPASQATLVSYCVWTAAEQSPVYLSCRPEAVAAIGQHVPLVHRAGGE